MTKTSIKLIHEGKYAAEVPIELHYSDDSWSPTMSATTRASLIPSGWRCAVAT